MTRGTLAFTILLLSALASSAARADRAPRVIYGSDDHTDITHTDPNPVFHAVAQATALLISRQDILANPARPSTRRLNALPLGVAMNLCPGERFSEEPSAGFCSGFLVTPEILVTAGHCVTTMDDCTKTALVFGYGTRHGEPDPTIIPTSDIYHCRGIIAHLTQTKAGVDFSIITLDRPVNGRLPVEIRREGSPSPDDMLASIGHPMGIPLKVVAGGRVRALTSRHVTTNLDGMTSGAPVFSPSTGLIEGLIVRGENDFVIPESLTGKRCRRHKICDENECLGEDATLTTVFQEFIPRD
jgi:hypothetical protein